jgi:hypothetical protein
VRWRVISARAIGQEGEAIAGEKDGVLGIEGDTAHEQRQGFARAPLIDRDQAEPMDRGGVAGILGKSLFIECARVGETAGGMQRDGLGDVGRGRLSHCG